MFLFFFLFIYLLIFLPPVGRSVSHPVCGPTMKVKRGRPSWQCHGSTTAPSAGERWRKNVEADKRSVCSSKCLLLHSDTSTLVRVRNLGVRVQTFGHLVPQKHLEAERHHYARGKPSGI